MNLILSLSILSSPSAFASTELLPNVVRLGFDDTVETMRGSVSAREIRLGDVIRLGREDFEVEGLVSDPDAQRIPTKRERTSMKDWFLMTAASLPVAAFGALSHPSHAGLSAGCAIALVGVPMAVIMIWERTLGRKPNSVILRLDRPRPPPTPSGPIVVI